ncbi:hypothetical protein [Pseudoalteromonas nigrifaciens]|uniref:hypothetical protein n=1 Tax=Pseudoalteromonas nigrifaciens TaxID=28109 RepID=UPI003FD1DF55
MLTLFEIIEQRKLKKNGADTYEVTAKVFLKNGQEKLIELDFYAEDEREAINMAERLRLREQAKLNEGDTTIDRLGLNFKETLDNKWGLIAPWKDPVYKRSIVRGCKLPFLRAASNMRTLKSSAFKDYKTLLKSDLDNEGMNKHINKCIKDYIFCAFIFLFSTYSLAFSWFNEETNTAYWMCCFLFVTVFTSTQLAKAIYKHKLLLKWKGEINAKQ